MFDFGALGDLALGAAALAGLRGLRKDVKEGFKGTADALSLHSKQLDEHAERLAELEVVTIEAGEPTLLGFKVAAKRK